MCKNILDISKSCDHIFLPIQSSSQKHQKPSSQNENKNSKLNINLRISFLMEDRHLRFNTGSIASTFLLCGGGSEGTREGFVFLLHSN